MKDKQTELQNESPMIQRVRTGKFGRGSRFSFMRLSIPRKGRIRTVLIILIVAAGVKLYSNFEIKSHSIPQKTHSPSITDSRPVAKETPRRASVFSFFKRSNKLGYAQQAYIFSRDTVRDLLRQHLPDFQSIRDTLKRGDKRYIFHYSLDTAMQNQGETLLRRYHPKYGALIAMDPTSGRVLSLISYTREDEDSLGDNLFCKGIFPAASIFKTITAAGAIEKAHVSPDSTFSLAGRRYTLYKFQLASELQSYQDVSLADAYSMSINPVFGRIGIYVLGKAGLTEYMQKFGFNCEIPFDLDNDKPTADINMKDSLLIIAETASGFNKITRISPLFGALIASSVSEQGVMPIPSVVDSVTALDSCVVYRVSPQALRTPIEESTALKLKDMMSRVVQYGTARKSFRYARNSACFNDVEYGGKTGTVDDDELGKIDWFIGFARHISDPRQRIAVGVVTVHDEYWTVHSSFIGAELFRTYIRGKQKTKRENRIREDSDSNDSGAELAKSIRQEN